MTSPASTPQVLQAAREFVGAHDLTTTAPTDAFSAMRGLRPGIEVFFALPLIVLASEFGPSGAILSGLFTGGIVALGLLPVLLARTGVIVAATGTELLVLRSSRLRTRRPVALEQRLPRTGTLQFSDGGDRSVRIGGVRYWIGGTQSDVARRLARSEGTAR